MKARRRTLALLRLHRITEALMRRGVMTIRAAFDGVWLGVLDDEAMRLIDESYYDEVPKYADEAYNRRGLNDWERDAIDRFFAGRRRIVVTGAGGGREVLALLDLGYDALGFEPNVKLARFGEGLLARSGHPGRLRQVDRDAWPTDSGPCDGVIVGWGSYMLIRGRRRRVAFLRDARARLEPGAPLLVSFFARSGRPGYLRLVVAIGGRIRRLRGAEPVELGDAMERNYVHYFDRAEIGSELREAGFELAWYDAAGYGKAVGLASANEPASGAGPAG